MERAIILSTDGVIQSYHLPPNLQNRDTGGVCGTENKFKDNIINMEREIILDELKRSRGNMAKAARTLGITERMMGIRVAKYGIDPIRFK
jgi:Nif-specific regulatory protein